jgi:hypothetical protein
VHSESYVVLKSHVVFEPLSAMGILMGCTSISGHLTSNINAIKLRIGSYSCNCFSLDKLLELNGHIELYSPICQMNQQERPTPGFVALHNFEMLHPYTRISFEPPDWIVSKYEPWESVLIVMLRLCVISRILSDLALGRSAAS